MFEVDIEHALEQPRLSPCAPVLQARAGPHRRRVCAVGVARSRHAARHEAPAIIRAISAPGTARPWYEFRRRVIDAVRIEGGLRFWAENAAVLERAAREFGVPEEIIVATIGIETLYGKNSGTFRVLDALTMLAFDYPPRSGYFRSELEQYLLLTRETGLDPPPSEGRMPARSAFRSSCRAATVAMPSTSTATAGLTS